MISHEGYNREEAAEKLRLFEEQISNYTEDERAKILSALNLTRKAHESQRRSDGAYWEHPLRVAEEVVAVSGNADSVIAALLHDIVEDQSVKLLEVLGLPLDPKISEEQQAITAIKNLFGSRVSELVGALTNPDFAKTLSEQGVDKNSSEYDEKYIALYVQHVKEIVEDPEAALIKFLDFRENGLSLSALPEGKRKSWLIKKYRPLVDMFIEKINDPITPLAVVNKDETLDRLYDAARYMDSLSEA